MHLYESYVIVVLVAVVATYLLTFILCFDRNGWYKRGLFRWLLPVALGVLILGVFGPDAMPASLTQIVLVYLACLFVGCMFCHGELAARKPHAKFLTSFYLMISLGGPFMTMRLFHD